MSTVVVPIPVGPLETNAHLVVSAGEALLVDPGGNPQRLSREIRRAGVGRIVAIALTHGHFDHVAAAMELKATIGAPVLLHPSDLALYRNAAVQSRLFGFAPFEVPEPDRSLVAGEKIPFGRTSVRVLHTPGHTPGGVCFLGEGYVLCGDTLFAGSVGRTDLPGGSSRQLMESIRRELLPLPDETKVYPGHGPATTIGRERRGNPFLAGMR